MTNAPLKLIAVSISLLLLVVNLARAQESPKRPAAIAFDIDGQAILNSKLFKMIPIPVPMRERLSVLKSRRLFGAASLPESIAQVIKFGPGGDFPIDFIAIAEFNSEEDRESVIPTAQLANSEKITLNGKEYYVEPSVENIHLLLEEKRFEIGSKSYLLIPKSSLLSSNLKNAMTEMGKAPAKFVVDLTADREFFQDAVDFMKQRRVPATVTPFLELPMKLDQLLLAIDPDGNELLKLTAHCSNPQDAAFVAKSLNMLVGFAKLSNQNAPKGTPGVELNNALLASTSLETNGNSTTLLIKKPADFEGMMERAAKGQRRINEFKQVLLAVHNYESTYGKGKMPFIAHDQFAEDLSWRVRLLPYVEQAELYNQFDVTQAWDSEKNKPLAGKCPEILGKDGMSNKCWVVSDAKSFADITDGLSNTICVIENPKQVPWTHAKDISIEDAEKLILELADGETLVVAFYDGFVRELSNDIDPQVLHALLTPNGGEVTTFVR